MERSVSILLLGLAQGRSDGGYMGIYTPKISPSKLLWGKNDVRTAIQQFYTPKNFYTPKTNFWLRPCRVGLGVNVSGLGWAGCKKRTHNQL